MNEQEKDYSLLRPFDLEAFKTGEKALFITYNNHAEVRTYVAGPDEDGRLCVSDEYGAFRLASITLEDYFMAPLAWVEGKPVYKGDVLYSAFFERPFEVSGYRKGYDLVGYFEAKSISDVAHCKISSCTWTPPKVKRTAWVNIYNNSVSCWLFSTREEADAAMKADDSRKACIQIEWEE